MAMTRLNSPVQRSDYLSWGRAQPASHFVSRPTDVSSAIQSIGSVDERPRLGFGCGRSYGDVALNPDGTLVDCRGLDRFISFDRETGILECEAGVRLADILAVVCKPDADGSGWLLPVSPGTRFVTVAGAIANDVHGKNHHGFGTFGRHTLSFDIVRGDGRELTCSAQENAELFAATIGGLGLTGFILRARLGLRRVPGLAVEAEDVQFSSLDDFFALSHESDEAWDYTAAWIDCAAAGQSLGRGIYSRARHVPGREANPPQRTPRLSVPMTPPFPFTTRPSVRAFNALYWRKLGRRTRTRRIQSYASTIYPLDAIGDWNRIYGRNGFFQFQSVVPLDGAAATTTEMLRQIAASGEGSMLSVLKIFGDLPSPGMLSFPMPGVTLALDFPNRGRTTRDLFARLERIVCDAGGRIYPAKDGLMSADAFRRGYPSWDAFRRQIDPRFSSSFARRVGLVAPERLSA